MRASQIKVGSIVRGRYTKDQGVVVGIFPSGFCVRFGTKTAQIYHPHLHLIAYDGTDLVGPWFYNTQELADHFNNFPKDYPKYWKHPIGSIRKRSKNLELVEVIGHRMVREAYGYLIRNPSGEIFELYPWNLE